MDESQTNTLRIGIRELHALLDKIERDRPASKHPSREFVRWQFRIVRADLTIEHTTGSKVTLPVATRNISRGGISILHSSFVYPGSACHITAQFEEGGELDMNGIVQRCDHLGGKVHEIGIKFDNEISTKELLGLDPMQEAYSLECIDPEGLHGTILLISGEDLDQQLLVKLLVDTSLTISVADSPESAVSRSQKGCELILTDYQVGEHSASDILSCLRGEGVDVPVLVMISDSSQSIRDEMRMAGASGLVTKPFTRDRLLQALAEFLLADGDTGPLYSTLSTSDPAYEILSKFLSDLSRMILTLERALRDSDYDICLKICRSLSCSAAPLGFETIGQLAVQTERALSKGSAVRDAAADIRQLIIACRRIKAKPLAAA
jgi:CheY-like chemotaxis protein